MWRFCRVGGMALSVFARGRFYIVYLFQPVAQFLDVAGIMYHDTHLSVEQAFVGRYGEVADIHGHIVGDDVGDAVEHPHAVDAVNLDFYKERLVQVFVPFH